MTDDTSPGVSFNLLSEPWIPVLWRDGRWGRVGIRQALAEAGHIRQIALIAIARRCYSETGSRS